MRKYTVDVPSNHPDKKMPVLDLQVWLEGKQIKYIFYEKPMKSSKVIEKKSALPYTMKMRALTQEAFRRIHNTEKGVFEENKGSILSHFMQKLKNSGYNEQKIYNIMIAGFKTKEKTSSAQLGSAQISSALIEYLTKFSSDSSLIRVVQQAQLSKN